MAHWLRDAVVQAASMGAAGYVAFILLYACACIAFLPLTVLMFGAGAVFGVVPAFGLVWIGATLGAGASFLLARYWLRDLVEKRAARMPLFAAIDAAMATQGRRVVFLTRLAPLFPFTLLNYAYGLTRVKFKDYMLASCVGMIPRTWLFVYLGAAAGDAVKAGTWGRQRTPAEWVLYAVGFLCTVAVAVLVGRESDRALTAERPKAARS